MNDEPSMQSLGGKARAEKLTPEQLSNIGKDAAGSRWNKPLALHEGELPLGENKLSCAVVRIDGEMVRLISSGEFMKALGRPWKGSYKRTERPNFLEANNLQQFITSDLESVLQLIEYRTPSGGTKRGYRAELVPLVCEVYLRAREQPKFPASQIKIAKACEIIMRSLAKLGIIALVDEATGYQNIRARDALAKILEAFIAKELQPWTRTFPIEFYQRICELKGWGFNPEKWQGPRCLAQLTNDIVYRRLAPRVLDELRSKNPIVDGRRKGRIFQWLTGDIGHPKLLAHLEGVKIIQRESTTWEDFQTKLDRHYPILETTDLGFSVTLSRKPKP